MKYVQASLGGLPGPIEIQSIQFSVKDFAGVKAYVLPDAEEYSPALDPARWKRSMRIGKRRSQKVTTTDGLELVVRRMRTQDNIVEVGFSEEFPQADPREHITKAEFIYKNLRYEDDEIVVSAERPLGFVRHPDGKQEEVYLDVPKGFKKFGDFKGDDRVKIEKAYQLYQKIKNDVGGIQFIDTDMVEREDNVLFRFDERGRTEIFKKDTEYTRVVDLERLGKECERVDEMLKKTGFDPQSIEGKTLYSSRLGFSVAERLIETTNLMNTIQKQELLSPKIAGELVDATIEYSQGDPGEFMTLLTTILSQSKEIVPEERCEFIKTRTTAIKESGGDETTYFRLAAKSRKHKRIRPVGDEKDGLVWN